MNRTNSKFSVKNLVLGALFLALALVLPFFTGHIPQIGAMLCPMHLPILLAGFVCGGPVGAVVGFIAPLLRMVMFGMPPSAESLILGCRFRSYFSSIIGRSSAKIIITLPILPFSSLFFRRTSVTSIKARPLFCSLVLLLPLVQLCVVP